MKKLYIMAIAVLLAVAMIHLACSSSSSSPTSGTKHPTATPTQTLTITATPTYTLPPTPAVWVKKAYRSTINTVDQPMAMCFDPMGYLYIAEGAGTNTTGTVEIYDETQSPATFVASFSVTGTSKPVLWGIAYNYSCDDLWVSDNANNDVYAINGLYDLNGTLGYVWDDLKADGYSIWYPYNLASDSIGNVFVMDSGNIYVEEYSYNEGWISATHHPDAQITKWGYDYFYNPISLATDTYDNVYAGDPTMNAGHEGIMAWYSSDLVESDFWAMLFPTTPINTSIRGIGVDEYYLLYCADALNGTVDVYDWKGTLKGQYTGFSFPTDSKVNPINGHLCVSDHNNKAVYIYY